jgi:ectoine hydroxylase-related dioxygenase (phytanoyl-CoA dioxygenase family)
MGVLSNPFVEGVARPLLRQWYRRQTPRVLSAEQRAFWDANGFLVLPGHFTRAQIDAVNGHIGQLWTESRDKRRETVVDIFIGTPREKRTHLSDAPLDARLTPHKLNDLYLESDVIRQIVLEERLASVLEEVLEGPPLVCNSLNLEFGSQQRDHTDSLYMTAPVGLYLAASWIALEDGSPDSGPLRYYAGSHKIPPFLFTTGAITAVDAEMPRYYEYMQRELERRGIKPETFVPKIGDAFIWHSQLYHGGEPIRNAALTRRSLVTHYWRAQDVPRRHGTVGPHRYYFRRPAQRVDAPVDDH